MGPFLRMIGGLLALIVLSTVPASAGTRDDPEITDPCGGLPPVYQDTDICAAWFQGEWEVVADPDHPDKKKAVFEGIDVSLDMAADVSDPSKFVVYLAGWTIGSCSVSWSNRFVADLVKRETVLFVRCEGAEAISIPVSDAHVSYAGNTITVHLKVDDELSSLRGLFSEGQQLTSPEAKTWFGARTATGPGEGLGETIEADWTDPGRTFVIGQDRPETETGPG
ncbi:MAG: hypothetical protein ABR600_12715 [Actinomycetota bacterium]